MPNPDGSPTPEEIARMTPQQLAAYIASQSNTGAAPIGVPKGFKPQSQDIVEQGPYGPVTLNRSAEQSGATGSTLGWRSPNQPINLLGGTIGSGNKLIFTQDGQSFTTGADYKQYVEGDQYRPANDPEAIGLYQSEMINAGLLKPQDVRPGIWDQKSADAYKTVLAFANQNGTTADQALRALGQNPKVATTDRGAYYRIAAEGDIRNSFQNAARQLTGGELPAAQEQDYYQYYREQEMKNAAASHSGGVVVDPESADAYVRAHDQGQINGFDTANRMLAFYRMMGINI